MTARPAKNVETRYRATHGSGRLHLMVVVADQPSKPANAIIQQLLDSGWWVFGARTRGVKYLRTGDRLCIYRTRIGVVAEAEIATPAEYKALKVAPDPARFPWAARIKEGRSFFDRPVKIDSSLRARIDAFAGKDPSASGAWFVQSSRLLTEHDFQVLVGR